jgi:WD40 repeat protein
MPQRFVFAWSAILGYDIFISYRRSDGSAYAEKLWRDLKSAGLTPFLDRDETPGGAQLTPTLVRALRKSRMLVVLLTPDVLDSEWVQQEVETFAGFKRRAIVPINIDNYIGRHNLESTRLARLKDYSWIEETREGLETGVPSRDVLTEIAKGFRKVRVRSISRAITATVMVALAVAAVTTFIQMRRAQREARVAVAAQTAAQAELIQTQDHAQIDLAASLAFDSLQRSPSLQAERAMRAGLESLPIQLASITVGNASDIAFAPDGTSILALSEDGRKVALHGQSGTPPRELWSCARDVPCSVFVRAGVALTATARAGGSSTIRLIDIMTGAQRAEFEWDAEPATLLTNELAHVIAAINAAGHACMWKAEGTSPPTCIDGPAGASWSLSHNGQLLASRLEDEDDDEKVLRQVWNTESGKEVLRTGGSLSMSSTGQFAATTSGNTYVRVYKLPERDPLPDFHHGDTIGGVAFDPTDRLMATWSYDYQLRLWAFEVERPHVPVAIGQAGRHRGLTGFTNDSLGIVTVASNPAGGSDVLIWRPRVRDRDRSLVQKQLLRHDSDVRAVVSHRDGTTYATLDDKGVARLWDTRDGNAASVSYVDSEPPEEPAVTSCRGGPASTWFSRLWSAKVVEGGADPKDARAVDPCGAFFAVVTKRASMGRDPEVLTVYSASTRQEVTRIDHAANMNSAAFSSDGRYLVTGGEDHLIRVFDLLANQQVASIEMETEVRSARFTPDDRYIVAVGTDELLGRIPVVTWRWKPADLLEAMTARGTRRMSRDEWSRFLGAEPPLVPTALVVQ